jgi:hypothetical protein
MRSSGLTPTQAMPLKFCLVRRTRVPKYIQPGTFIVQFRAAIGFLMTLEASRATSVNLDERTTV